MVNNITKYVTANLSALCLTEAQMQMHGTAFEKYLQRYLFPALAIFGILGNALNLTVLLNKKMRSRANTFLAALAFADICFLSLLLPNALANWSPFTMNYYFRYAYFETKVHLIAFANWSSAVAIWCVIAVCADRLIGIRQPLYARSHSSSYKTGLVLAAIVLLPGLLTFYQHYQHACFIRSYCNGAQLYSRCFPANQEKWGNMPNQYSLAFRRFINWSTLLNVCLIIIFPIILLTTLNMLLLCALRQRSNNLMMIEGGGNSNGNSNAVTANGQQSASSKPCIDNLKHHKTEQRVTLTVALIVSVFTLTNGPSALVHLLQTIYHQQINSNNTAQRDWYNVTLLCSALVILGKASNFIAFCLCSKHFRRRLFTLAQKKVHEKLESRRRSSSVALNNPKDGSCRKGTLLSTHRLSSMQRNNSVDITNVF